METHLMMSLSSRTSSSPSWAKFHLVASGYRCVSEVVRGGGVVVVTVEGMVCEAIDS